MIIRPRVDYFFARAISRAACSRTSARRRRPCLFRAIHVKHLLAKRKLINRPRRVARLHVQQIYILRNDSKIAVVIKAPD